MNTLPYLGDEMKPFFAAITVIISLITAAAAIVPCRMPTKSGCEAKVAQAIPVKTRETHIIIKYFPQDAEYRYAVKADRKNMDLVWMP